MPSQTTPPEPESPSSPITAPGIRVKAANSNHPPKAVPSPPTPSQTEPTPPPLDPVDATVTPSGDKGGATKGPKGGQAPWKEIARGLVTAGTAWVHDRFARTEEEIEKELWVATPAEAARIADPGASMAERHGLPVGENQDMNDFIQIAFGVLAYLGRNVGVAIFAKLSARRRLRAAARVVDADPGPRAA